MYVAIVVAGVLVGLAWAGVLAYILVRDEREMRAELRRRHLARASRQ